MSESDLIRVIQGDCADVFRDVRGLEAIVADPPSYMKFMGRKWDTSAPDKAYVPPIAPRSKKHLRELQERHTFVKYWAERLAIAYDACADDAVALIWAIPKQADATMEAMRLAGWRIADTITHLFGQGWPKSKRELKPASELWIVGIKGSPKLGIDACRVERGLVQAAAGGIGGYGGIGEPYAQGHGREYHSAGSWPTNAILSHFASDELTCIRDGVRRVTGTAPKDNRGRPGNQRLMAKGTDANKERTDVWEGFGAVETLPAYRCVCACDCGARWLVLAGGDAPRCQCGRMARWACPVAALDAMSGVTKSGSFDGNRAGVGYGSSAKGTAAGSAAYVANEGGCSRFFNTFAYFGKASGRVDNAEQAKLDKLTKKLLAASDPHVIAKLERAIEAQTRVVEASDEGVPRGERHAGCEELYWKANDENPFGFDRVTKEEAFDARGNAHATVKSLALMMHLHALSGARRIGDLCAGSGSGAVAALIANRTSERQIEWIGAEMCAEAIAITNARLAFWGGLTDAALAAFITEDEMPAPEKKDPMQRSLF